MMQGWGWMLDQPVTNDADAVPLSMMLDWLERHEAW
jgi:hypothetical protein